ncbi:hypothetical protein DSM112329_00559 [Paraconexibacter sp. AEG42_29]|uniref:DUF4402 domain-containing protein n=1 Tax=Paraconexibacter sp. AEG42_29 TaxID=2997339 RepID=A0AAU7AQ40_9ACTN
MRAPAVLLGLLLTGPALLTASVAAADDAPPPAPAQAPAAAPAVSELRFAPQPLRPGRTGTFRFLTTHGGAVTIALHRQVVGRRQGTRCVSPAKARPGARPCLQAVPVGTLRSAVDPGEGARRFDGIVAGRRLPPGRYRATLRVTSGAAGVSAPAYVTVRIAATG